MKPGDIMVCDSTNTGIWELVSMITVGATKMWVVKFPFTSSNLSMISCVEEDLRKPTIEDLGYLRLKLDQLIRDIVMKSED